MYEHLSEREDILGERRVINYISLKYPGGGYKREN
jgi:hypothetical protein